MKYQVKKRFQDKYNGNLYEVGSFYETDNQGRADYLQGMGYLGAGTEESSLLAGNVDQVKASITADMTDDELNALLDEEQAGKNRKGVIDHINSLLEADDR